MVRDVTTQEINHHEETALDTLLAHYARGALSAPLHVLVASHLELRPESRRFVGALEGVVASAIVQEDPVHISDRDARLAAIFAAEAESETPVRARSAYSGISGDVPHPLARYLGQSLTEVPWRSLLPGVKEYRIEDNEEGEAVLYWIKGGRKMPFHTHEGSEYTLVLKGAFSDLNGHYGRGDIAIADADVDHRPIADPDADCFCFAVTDAPLKLTGPIGRIVQRFFIKH
ncbi:MAG: putative transcriptional regulator [Saliniramus fredricksonii]|uniref:Anti-ECFsigma factor, ChrR n=1 Tax=Saliniramus fredricksonii TaxID=1653334 RepID=A0A0P7YB23_9HYPH|nr:MAG: putative transcriptional regulator [Saliniramus fredricksonii]SCC81766.1 anti-ECFsigma factor, ChrR [Saliniramus fredricksonii]